MCSAKENLAGWLKTGPMVFHSLTTQIGFNGGTPITEEFFIKNISGKHNEELREILLPDWEIQRSRKFLEDKEALFRR